MTPIPSAVAAAIVAAGHCLRVETDTATGYGRSAWTWGDGPEVSPLWIVTVGERPCYRPVQGADRGEMPRDALLGALAALARHRDALATEHRKRAARRRDANRRAYDNREALAGETKAADVRTLAATIAALWPAPPTLSAAEVAVAFPEVNP